MTRTTDTGAFPVSSLIGAPVAGVRPDAPLVEVAVGLHSAGVGALVVGDAERPVGIVSERDLVAAVAAGRDLAATTASDIAHTELVWCDVEATVAEVASEMMDNYVRHVLVEDGGRLVGVVSARDLLGIYAADDADPDAGFF
jgi:CBS domain-containing protein